MDVKEKLEQFLKDNNIKQYIIYNDENGDPIAVPSGINIHCRSLYHLNYKWNKTTNISDKIIRKLEGIKFEDCPSNTIKTDCAPYPGCDSWDVCQPIGSVPGGTSICRGYNTYCCCPKPTPKPKTYNVCGKDWADASKCKIQCPNKKDDECPENEKCQGDIPCTIAPPTLSPTPAKPTPPQVNSCGVNSDDALYCHESCKSDDDCMDKWPNCYKIPYAKCPHFPTPAPTKPAPPPPSDYKPPKNIPIYGNWYYGAGDTYSDSLFNNNAFPLTEYITAWNTVFKNNSFIPRTKTLLFDGSDTSHIPKGFSKSIFMLGTGSFLDPSFVSPPKTSMGLCPKTFSPSIYGPWCTTTGDLCTGSTEDTNSIVNAKFHYTNTFINFGGWGCCCSNNMYPPDGSTPTCISGVSSKKVTWSTACCFGSGPVKNIKTYGNSQCDTVSKLEGPNMVWTPDRITYLPDASAISKLGYAGATIDIEGVGTGMTESDYKNFYKNLYDWGKNIKDASLTSILVLPGYGVKGKYNLQAQSSIPFGGMGWYYHLYNNGNPTATYDSTNKTDLNEVFDYIIPMYYGAINDTEKLDICGQTVLWGWKDSLQRWIDDGWRQKQIVLGISLGKKSKGSTGGFTPEEFFTFLKNKNFTNLGGFTRWAEKGGAIPWSKGTGTKTDPLCNNQGSYIGGSISQGDVEFKCASPSPT